MSFEHRLPKNSESYWLQSEQLTNFQQLHKDIHTDVVIIGAGITGITLAHLLTQSGVKVVLLDADRIMNGTTGHTTAKVTVQHGLIYDKLIKQIGVEKAKLYFEANNQALDFVKNTVSQCKIQCDFSEQDAYVYTNKDEYMEELVKELEAYKQIGINGELVNDLPISIPVKRAIVVRNQAQFHPVKYLNHLVEEMMKNGCIVIEETTAINIDYSTPKKVLTNRNHEIKAKKVVIATHFPFYDLKGLFFARLEPQRSYVVAARSKQNYQGGMYISAESPTRSIRSTPVKDGEHLLLIGGEGHKVGQDADMMNNYEILSQFTSEHFQVEDFPYRWSAQDLVTMDDVPYVGNITENEQDVYVATGYAKWGMTNGTAAALLLSDMILGRDNQYTNLYSPSRFSLNPTLKKLVSTNLDVAKHLIKGKLENPERTKEDFQQNEGGVILHNGKRAGCYKDEQGIVHIVDTTCSHLGCEVAWNNSERSWDCPCHGSRFSYKGEVLEGPAETPLEKIE